MKVTLDYETRSLINLVGTSAHRYAVHPSTEVLCLALKVESEKPLWWAPDWIAQQVNLPRFATKAQVEDIFSRAEIIEAHNAEFEMAITSEIMVRRHGFTPIPFEKWRCSMAKGLMHALPASLGKLAAALHVPEQKDKGGRALMLKMCKPITPSAAAHKTLAQTLGLSLSQIKEQYSVQAMLERGYSRPEDKQFINWHEDFEGLIRYCRQDVEAEHSVSSRLREMPPYEIKVWQLSCKINQRGIPIDLPGAKGMAAYVSKHQKELLEQFPTATGGKVSGPKCYVAFRKWLATQGVEVPGVSAEHLRKALKGDMPEGARKAINIALLANKSSTAKYDAMVRGESGDSRVRGAHVYHKASTGRWAGSLIQGQNMPRECFPDSGLCLDMVARGEYELAEMFFGSPTTAASKCLRGAVKASPGKKFVAADFSAIEGRVLAWLAGEEAVLEEYRRGYCPYCATASRCFGVPYEDIKAGYEAGEEWAIKLRAKGKTGELACGFGGSTGSVAKFAKDMSYRDRKVLVQKWRASRPKTKEFWYGLMDTAINAMRNPGRPFRCGKIAYMYDKTYGFLICKLPSGRKLYYYEPWVKAVKIGPGVEADKAFERPGVNFDFGNIFVWVDPQGILHLEEPEHEELLFTREEARKAPQLWKRDTYAISYMSVVENKWARRELNSLVASENVTQAAARDLLVAAMFEVEAAGLPIVMHVHDELVCEVDESDPTTAEDLSQIMCAAQPDWSAGLPLEANGWVGPRFRK